MKKLILKSQVADVAKLEQKLANIGSEFSAAVWQHERIYWPSDFKPGMNQPRMILRTEVTEADQPANYRLFLKRHIEDSGVDWTNSTQVADYTEATGIIHQLGFRKAAEISRQRRELRLDAQTVLYLDTIEGVDGSFLKIEIKVLKDESVEAVRAVLFSTLRLLGLETFVTQTYAEMLNGVIQPYYLPEE